MLFSEPKIPQSSTFIVNEYIFWLFQCSSASRKFLNLDANSYPILPREVSVLFSEPKIPQSPPARRWAADIQVSVLFSEPKIPQSGFESRLDTAAPVSVLFSEPKIPQFNNCDWRDPILVVSVLFSEPKIPQSLREFLFTLMLTVSVLFSEPKIPQFFRSNKNQNAIHAFQCSSASRKFLNVYTMRNDFHTVYVSVLFSEPKIPQSNYRKTIIRKGKCFSALQRAENSSIHGRERGGRD